MTKLTLQHITKRFGEHEIIRDFNLTMETGELLVVVGPSGCGKSTLLRMIAGLESVSSGDIFIDDKNVNHLEPKARNIAMVFQNYALYPHMTVYENMAYGLRMRGKKKHEIKKQVEATASILGLEELLSRRPQDLSGGQRQRVAMGRAIVRKPKLFLFDEPLSNLDAKLRVQMRLEIKKLQRTLGITSIYVTHDQQEAMTLADRLIVMNQGKIEQIATPLDIYHQPASMFVAEFIGSPPMNLMPDTQHVVGIRPEDFLLEGSEKAQQYSLQVDMMEVLGADNLLYGHLRDQQHRVIVRVSRSHKMQCGDIIQLLVEPSNIHRFDANTGIRL